MSDAKPDGNEPLSPYYPSDIPDLSGNGRKWVALLLTAMIVGGGLYGVLRLFFPL